MGIKEACPDDDQHIIIDIPKDLEPDLNSSSWIHRVPGKIRQLKEEAYTPQLIFVGPFHYGNPKLRSMEHHKTRYHDQFWKWYFYKHIKVDDIKDFIEDGDIRESIWRSYARTLGFGNDLDQLFHVILIDACFIFKLFLRNYEISSHGKLLDEEMQHFKRIKHFTDLVRQFLCPNKRCPIHAGNISFLYTAKQLDSSGCVYPFETYICNYVSFLDQLIDKAEDVELLVEKKVVHNLLGSNDAVADLINKLCDQILETSFYYGGIWQELNEHYDNF
ncbi:uncharacterized protein LOC132804412 [Ziziphus jujuba]|uniref:Uncharacterized protein LOC132804412 n=1 Tax=Ziziphus jujuba TaxID=326968 RepID=A0ABM4ADD4_ZIZJJ|nr:uncharacterized protein LOC132804412 [Ziziphus jujuba]